MHFHFKFQKKKKKIITRTEIYRTFWEKEENRHEFQIDLYTGLKCMRIPFLFWKKKQIFEELLFDYQLFRT